MNFFIFFSFLGLPGSGSADPIESGSNSDPDPKHLRSSDISSIKNNGELRSGISYPPPPPFKFLYYPGSSLVKQNIVVILIIFCFCGIVMYWIEVLVCLLYRSPHSVQTKGVSQLWSFLWVCRLDLRSIYVFVYFTADMKYMLKIHQPRFTTINLSLVMTDQD